MDIETHSMAIAIPVNSKLPVSSGGEGAGMPNVQGQCQAVGLAEIIYETSLAPYLLCVESG